MDQIVMPSDAERQLLRDSLRGLLDEYWPSSEASKRKRGAPELLRLWRKLGAQGIPSLGTDPAEGGLREIAVAMEELGRSGCPAPMIGAVLVNTLLWPKRSESDAIQALASAVHEGTTSVSVAMGAFDLDPTAGSARLSGGVLTGQIDHVEGGAHATHFLVFLSDGPAVAIVERNARGVEVVDTPAFGIVGLSRLSLSKTPATIIAVSREVIEDANLVTRVCLVARALGAADRAFELVVDYAKYRRQFGRTIGSFQAVQHKLANCRITLQGVRTTMQNVAANHDNGVAAWRVFASAAYAYAAASIRQVSLETHHAFGAVGYAEEHEATVHFRTVHLDVVRHGGVRQAREELAHYLLDGEPRGLPEYDLGPAGNQFRKEVRAWLEQHWTGERKEAQERLPFHERAYNPEFASEMGKTGWIAMAWPKEYGGQERTAFEQIAYLEELERAEAPRAGAPIMDVAFMVYGTPEQKEKFLPAIKRGEVMFGLGYSETESGSDLASLRTRAVRDGDEWVINGEKIWTTTWWASYVWLAVRTDPDAKPRHAGLSVLAVPMNTPGIKVTTMETLYGGNFANVFYDNVRVPADALIGKVNGGWEVITGCLATERGLVGSLIVAKINHVFTLLCDYIRQAEVNGKPLRLDPIVRDRIGGLAAELEVARQMGIYCVSMIEGGKTPQYEAAMCKVYAGELMERFYEAAVDILGMRATLSEDAPGAILKGRIEQRLRHSLMWVISLGTNEIQRNLIATQGLGLPKA